MNTKHYHLDPERSFAPEQRLPLLQVRVDETLSIQFYVDGALVLDAHGQRKFHKPRRTP